jgi:hypothetical protein
MTLVTILFPDVKSSRYYVFNSVIYPYQTYFVYFIFKPIDLLKCSIKTSVFFTSDENTSDATIGQKWYFWSKFLSNGQSNCSLSSSWWSSKKKCSSGHFFRSDKINCNTSGLSGKYLTDHTLCDF